MEALGRNYFADPSSVWLRVRGGAGNVVRGFMFCAGGFAVFLLALLFLDVGHADAQTATTLWSKDITVRHDGGGDGYHKLGAIFGYGDNSSDNTTFTYGGATYTVKSIDWNGPKRSNGNQVWLRTEPLFSPSERGLFELQIKDGDYTYRYNYSDGRTYTTSVSRSGSVRRVYTGWSSESPGWAVEDKQVKVSIIRLAAADNALRFAPQPVPVGTSGRLEIFDLSAGDSGQWKWICNDGFGEEEAEVACRQLGHTTGEAEVLELPEDWLEMETNPLVGIGIIASLYNLLNLTALMATPGLLDEVDCGGDESRLIDCEHAGRGVTDCNISESVGATCNANGLPPLPPTLTATIIEGSVKLSWTEPPAHPTRAPVTSYTIIVTRERDIQVFDTPLELSKGSDVTAVYFTHQRSGETWEYVIRAESDAGPSVSNSVQVTVQ